MQNELRKYARGNNRIEIKLQVIFSHINTYIEI